MDPDKIFINWAVSDLRRLNANMYREEATFVLSIWEQMVQLRKESPEVADELTVLVLAHFPTSEPPNVPGKDWLPSAAEVASYNTAIAESLAAPAPVKAVRRG